MQSVKSQQRVGEDAVVDKEQQQERKIKVGQSGWLRFDPDVVIWMRRGDVVDTTHLCRPSSCTWSGSWAVTGCVSLLLSNSVEPDLLPVASVFDCSVVVAVEDVVDECHDGEEERRVTLVPTRKGGCFVSITFPFHRAW